MSHHAMIDEGYNINEVYACMHASVNIVLGGTGMKRANGKKLTATLSTASPGSAK